MARYSKEQTDAVIDAAVEALGLESLKHQQREAIHVVSGQDVFVARLAGFWKSVLLPRVFNHLAEFVGKLQQDISAIRGLRVDISMVALWH